MKVIGILQALSGLRGAEEEVSAGSHAPVRDIVEALRKRYKFAATTNLGFQQESLNNLVPNMIFRAGAFDIDDRRISIGQLAITANSILAACDNSDDADAVANDAAEILTEEFKFRFRGKHIKRYYLTNMVVEFDNDFVGKVPFISEIIGLIEQMMPKFHGAEEHVGFKRISFGRSAEDINDWDQVQRASFTIERRVGHSFDEGRYFCTAPVSSSNLISVLEKIEQIIASSLN